MVDSKEDDDGTANEEVQQWRAALSLCAAPAFYQQQLPSVPSVLPPYWCGAVLAALGAALIATGAALLAADARLAEFTAQYDGPGTPASLAACAVNVSRDAGDVPPCSVPVLVATNLKAPVFVSVKLGGFYQNHRSYVKSRSDTQISGVVFDSEAKLEECEPLISRGEQILHPCGLVANSFFNDTFSLAAFRTSHEPLNVTLLETGISWPSDRQRKYGAVPPHTRAKYGSRIRWINETYPRVADVTDEHFIVWMRTAATPTAQKLYGRIDADLQAGTTLMFSVQAVFPVASFGGSKSIVVSTAGPLGFKNPFLGVSYIAVGCLGLLAAGAFVVRAACGTAPRGDLNF